MWFLSSMAGAADCELSALDGILADAEAAFVALDAPALSLALGRVDHQLGCVRVVVPPATCARVHFVHALGEWTLDESDRGFGSLAAALDADRYFRVPDAVVPADHALRRIMWQAEEAPVEWTALRHPASIDGHPSRSVPEGHPYVLQQLADDGGPSGARRIVQGRSPSGGTVAMRWAAVGVGAASLGLWGGAWTQRWAYDQALLEPAREGEWRLLRQRTNGLSTASLVAGGLGVGLLSVSFALPKAGRPAPVAAAGPITP